MDSKRMRMVWFEAHSFETRSSCFWEAYLKALRSRRAAPEHKPRASQHA
jgi:hypothetical protein